jgi:hypothetical protein
MIVFDTFALKLPMEPSTTLPNGKLTGWHHKNDIKDAASGMQKLCIPLSSCTLIN